MRGSLCEKQQPPCTPHCLLAHKYPQHTDTYSPIQKLSTCSHTKHNAQMKLVTLLSLSWESAPKGTNVHAIARTPNAPARVDEREPLNSHVSPQLQGQTSNPMLIFTESLFSCPPRRTDWETAAGMQPSREMPACCRQTAGCADGRTSVEHFDVLEKLSGSFYQLWMWSSTS